jgi:hypothetical protein
MPTAHRGPCSRDLFLRHLILVEWHLFFHIYCGNENVYFSESWDFSGKEEDLTLHTEQNRPIIHWTCTKPVCMNPHPKIPHSTLFLLHQNIRHVLSDGERARPPGWAQPWKMAVPLSLSCSWAPIPGQPGQRLHPSIGFLQSSVLYLQLMCLLHRSLCTNVVILLRVRCCCWSCIIAPQKFCSPFHIELRNMEVKGFKRSFLQSIDSVLMPSEECK